MNIGIDWVWVRDKILKAERIDSDKIRSELDESIFKAKTLAEPKYTSIEKKITRLDVNGIELEGGVFFSTKKISQYIKGADSLILFLVTVGEGIEKAASSLISDKDPLNGYLLDRIGSFAVEFLAESFEKSLRKAYSLTKQSVSIRFSPGYCDWRIEEQFTLAKVLDFSKAGVTLTEGCMMVPKKSISAITAVAKEGVFKDFVSNCAVCEMKDCVYRRDS